MSKYRKAKWAQSYMGFWLQDVLENPGACASNTHPTCPGPPKTSEGHCQLWLGPLSARGGQNKNIDQI